MTTATLEANDVAKAGTEVRSVLELQGLSGLDVRGDWTSNLSLICKEQSTLSMFTCLPPGEGLAGLGQASDHS